MRRQFDALGRLCKEIRTINGSDATTEYGYDAQGNPTTTQKLLVAAYGETSAPKETRRYNSLNQLSQIEDALNGTAAPTTVTPRADDQFSGLTAPNAAGSTYQRDALNRPTAVTYSKAGSTSETFTYSWDSSTGGIPCSNGIGRLCKVVDNSGTSTFAYEPFGNLSRQRNVEATSDAEPALGVGRCGSAAAASPTRDSWLFSGAQKADAPPPPTA